MAYPTKPSDFYDYSAFQQSQGDSSFPGTEMDGDLAEIKTSADEIIDFITAAFRSDGILKASASPEFEDAEELLADAVETATDTATAAATSATASATAAASSATAASTSATAAATSATASAGSATSAAASATTATAAALAADAAADAAEAALAGATLTNYLLKSDNLASLASAATARNNLGLGTAATAAVADFATAAQGVLADSALQALPAGSVVQVVSTQTGAVATGTTILPNDDTIPQITEGIEFMTRAITPTNASNKLKIEVVITLANSAGLSWVSAALFQDATANALACSTQFANQAGGAQTITFTHYMTAGTTSATTFRVRGGGNQAGTTTLNGTSGGRLFGGVFASSITITEVKV